MTTKVHQCVNLYRDVMEGIINDATRIEKEMGMNFYQDKQGNCTIGDICTGDICNIELPSSKAVGHVIGMFHVHPTEESLSLLSPGDVLYHIQEYLVKQHIYVFSCVGSKNHGIQCYSILDSQQTYNFFNIYKKIVRHVDHNMRSHLRNATRLMAKMEYEHFDSLRPQHSYSLSQIKEIVDTSLTHKAATDDFITMYVLIINHIESIINKDKSIAPRFAMIYTILNDNYSKYNMIKKELDNYYYGNLYKILIKHEL